VALVLFVTALEVLRRELHSVTWQSLSARALGTPPWLLATAVLLTALNYVVLAGYDFIALSSIGKRLPALRVAVTSFLAFRWTGRWLVQCFTCCCRTVPRPSPW
jgi:uncharacterized membrane protein YbhN (UPF0104 family)